MSQQKTHDLFDFMVQMNQEIAAEYDRIQKRATEDPGTAGDQGEENWAAILRGWLPRNFEVVTKGRIISQEGITSPQIDVLVLTGDYPKKLLNKKLYLAAGVVAAFECKTTLKSSHIFEAMETCVKVKSLYPIRTGTPYKELHSPIVYGLLAHSHGWKGKRSTPEETIDKKLNEADRKFVSHPRLQLDILCVADLATWESTIMTFVTPLEIEHLCKAMGMDTKDFHPDGSTLSIYFTHSRLEEGQVQHFAPIGALISSLSKKLAWDNPSLRNLAEYYQKVRIEGESTGENRTWPSSIFSRKTRKRLEVGIPLIPPTLRPWNEWQAVFFNCDLLILAVF
jgi:hypothetical protein